MTLRANQLAALAAAIARPRACCPRPPTRCCASSSATIPTWGSTTARSSPKACSPGCAGAARSSSCAGTTHPAKLALRRRGARARATACASSSRARRRPTREWVRGIQGATGRPRWRPRWPRTCPTGCGSASAPRYGDAERAALARAWLAPGAARPARQSAEDDARGRARGAGGVGHRRPSPRPSRRSACASPAGPRSRAIRCSLDGRDRGAGRGQPAGRLPGRAAAHRHGRRLLRRRGRQDAAAGRADALAGAALRVRRRRQAAGATSSRGWRARGCRTCIRS